MTMYDERYEPWEEDWYQEEEDYDCNYDLDQEDLNFMHYEDETFDIEILDDNGTRYQSLEIQFECCAPVWSVLDVVSEFFEERGLEKAEIISMTTEIFDDDFLVLKVIYTC